MSRMMTAAAAAALFAAYGCGDGTATGLHFSPENVSVTEGQTANVKIIAHYDNGDEKDVTAVAKYTFNNDAMGVLDGKLVGVHPGTASITAEYDGMSGSADAKVGTATIEGLSVTADGDLKVGSKVQLHPMGQLAGGSSFEIKSDVTYTTSNEAIATVDSMGMVDVKAGGDVTITAAARGKEGTFANKATCTYPRYSTEMLYDRVIPPLSWPAYAPDGTELNLSFDDIYCNADWKDVKTVTFVVSAGWCNPCTMYAQRLATQYQHLADLGMKIVIMEVQDYDYVTAHSDFAREHLNRITSGNVPAYAVGDADTSLDGELSPGFVLNNTFNAFPTAIVVRTSDMRIIADGRRSDYYLPLDQIAENPDADWSHPGQQTFQNHCGTGDEEAMEPNDAPADAKTITAGTYHGGICTDAADLYNVDIAGDWSVSLDFDNAVGDLDIYVWDGATNDFKSVDGQIVGSSNGTGHETFSYSGPAMIAVKPYNHASAPYTLTVSE